MDKYKDLSVEEIAALATEKQAAFDALIGLETPTPAQVDEAEGLFTEIGEINAALAARQEAAEKEATAPDRFAALKERAAAASQEPEVEEEAEEEEPEESEEDAEEEPAEAEAEEPAPVEAATKTKVKARAKGVETLAKTAKRPAPPAVRRGSGPVSLVAAADTGFAAGQSLDSLLDVATAAINRAKGFPVPQGDGGAPDIRKFATATINIDFADELIVDEQDSLAQIGKVMDFAVDESRLSSEKGSGSLVAAGGWCAPSETVYDLDDDATTEGMLSLPEVGIRRGGMRWPVSPTFADFYANPGFIQTEAQAIAGTAKPCIEIDCPTFDEERMDAEGICIKVPILTNVGYPEYVRNFVSGSLTAHQHWINANVIGRLVTASGAARVFTGKGGTVSDAMESIGLVADQTRQKYRLSLNASVEVVVPFWVRTMMINDVERRTGWNQAGAAALIDGYFAERKAAVQYVYDWQPIDETAEVYPATFNLLVYPAGTFVKGTQPVINLSTVYDAASLAENVYTGLFVEQGLLVAHKKFHSDLITLPICNAGRTGASNITCP